MVKEIPSYRNDPNKFINKVNNFSVPINLILVTMSVKSLYTSVPNNEGIAATKQSMKTTFITVYPLNLSHYLQHSSLR